MNEKDAQRSAGRPHLQAYLSLQLAGVHVVRILGLVQHVLDLGKREITRIGKRKVWYRQSMIGVCRTSRSVGK
jgi:hypothetical protein